MRGRSRTGGLGIAHGVEFGVEMPPCEVDNPTPWSLSYIATTEAAMRDSREAAFTSACTRQTICSISPTSEENRIWRVYCSSRVASNHRSSRSALS